MFYTKKQMKEKVCEELERRAREEYTDRRFRELEERLYALERQIAKLSEEIIPTPARPPMPIDTCVRKG